MRLWPYGEGELNANPMELTRMATSCNHVVTSAAAAPAADIANQSQNSSLLRPGCDFPIIIEFSGEPLQADWCQPVSCRLFAIPERGLDTGPARTYLHIPAPNWESHRAFPGFATLWFRLQWTGRL